VTGNLSAQMNGSPYHYGPQPAPLGWRSGPPRYYAQKFGKPVIEKLAFFYSQVGAAIPLAREARRVYEAAGFKVVYERGIPPNDSNQTADVVQMQRAGVRAIAFQGDIVALGKLTNAMRQQNFTVDLLNLGNAVYDANTFKHTTADALKNVQIDQVYGLFLGEDGDRIPEVKLFNEWMKKTDPNQPVDLFALYGWLSGRLFADAMNKLADAGKTPVRKDLVETLKTWTTWDGYGLVAPVDIGKKRPSDCFFVFTVSADAKFRRTFPEGAKNFECGVGPFSYKP
jgi:ABC-type branched-subunit amino acid transport system substrate-binding protein